MNPPPLSPPTSRARSSPIPCSPRNRLLSVLAIVLAFCFVRADPRAAEFFVSPTGNDASTGSREDPFRSPAKARTEARRHAGNEKVTVHLLPGIHYLAEPLVLGSEDSGTRDAPVVWQASGTEPVVLSGGQRLTTTWVPHRDAILKARVTPEFAADQLFVDGRNLPMARYPDVDPAVRHFDGFAPDAFAPSRAARWNDPAGGFIHAMHRHEWGDFHYRILGKDAGNTVRYEGGWQNNRRLGMHDRYRMVENIFEELDAPGEWFHDSRNGWLYLYPPPGTHLESATIEIVRLRHLLECRGTPTRPVRHVSFRGITFRHAARTFMESKEPLLRSDWTLYRGGAVVFEGTEDCAIEDAQFDQVGGNAVMVTGYNRRLTARRCLVDRAGANGIAFVGEPRAVRNPLFEYAERQKLADLDRTPGPRTDDYPADCLVEDCLVRRTGRFEKQTAPVQIAMARRITVRHCSLYEVPRAGINIGDGCWGGHVIEFCDVFDTVLETGDHGSFNSWGRDRYWELGDVESHALTQGPLRDLPLLDAVEPTVLRNNRWRCDHGWDIDLDDGSSHYEIRDNLCLNGGIKLREGFFRVCENNIMVANSFHPHVWYRGSADVFRRNIVFDVYKPIRVDKPWGQECDANLLHVPGRDRAVSAEALRGQSGRDETSVVADAGFLDPLRGDYRVREDSPALALGFRNFPMDRFGVRTPRLRALARTPELPASRAARVAAEPESARAYFWMGATVKTLTGRAESSAVGVSEEMGGVLVLEVRPESPAAKAGFQAMDLIQTFQWKPVRTLPDLRHLVKDTTGSAELGIRRKQAGLSVKLEGPLEPRWIPAVPAPSSTP